MTQIILDKNIYVIPDILEIDPAQIIAEDNFLRVSIGKPDLRPEEKQAYDTLFEILKVCAKEPFITNIAFIVDNKELVFASAYVTCSNKPFGMFCDIEALENQHTYKVIEDAPVLIKGKKTKKEKVVK